MPDCIQAEAALTTLRFLIKDLEQRLEAATCDRERRSITTTLQARRLEEADFLDQLQDQGDLP